jgi:hypothetical protein
MEILEFFSTFTTLFCRLFKFHAETDDLATSCARQRQAMMGINMPRNSVNE